MDEGATGELESLRARAYGPDADIDEDPRARRRLEELEDLARRPAETATETVPEPPRLIDAVPGPGEHVDDAVEPDAAPAPEVEPAPPARSPWVMRATWAASLVGAVAVAVAATALVTVPLTPISPMPSDVEVHQVATLFVEPDFVVPENVVGGGGTGVAFQAFAGLRPVYSDYGWSGTQTDVCLALVDDTTLDPDAEFFQGSLYAGCGAQPFPAIVSIRVTEDLPQALQDMYPLGTPLQFVLDGSRVGVFVAD